MVSRILLRKLRRDLWRQRWQFLAAAFVIGIGVAVYRCGHRRLRQFETVVRPGIRHTTAAGCRDQRPGVFGLYEAARALPGNPVVELRQQAMWASASTATPCSAAPSACRSRPSRQCRSWRCVLVIFRHVGRSLTGGAPHRALTDCTPGTPSNCLDRPVGDTLDVSGSALSTEYFWPARSQREIMTTPENFGVVFVPAPDMPQLVAQPTDQLLVYARDRDQASALHVRATELARSRGMMVMSRDEQPSYRALQDDVDSVGTFARLLPWVFLVAAVVGTYVLLSRLVGAQRAVIGTLLANGLPGRTMRTHYLTYGVAVGLAGAAVGLIGGYFLGGWFTTQYTQALGLPLRVTSLHPTSLIIGALVGTAAAALAAWAPARAASRMSPAEAMRISPPGTRGGVSVAERLLPPLRRMPARWRMTLRGITRNRRRTILTIAGVVISVCLVMVFAGLRDTVNSVIDRQYGGIELQDAQVITARGAADAVAAALRADPQVAAAETVYAVRCHGSGPQQPLRHPADRPTADNPDAPLHLGRIRPESSPRRRVARRRA